MIRNTIQMKLYDKIESITSEEKGKLVEAFKNGDTDFIVSYANEFNTTDITIRNHIWKWLQILNKRDTSNILSEVPKDLSFTERLQLSINLIKYKYENISYTSEQE